VIKITLLESRCLPALLEMYLYFNIKQMILHIMTVHVHTKLIKRIIFANLISFFIIIIMIVNTIVLAENNFHILNPRFVV